jgi:hypothetical protein
MLSFPMPHCLLLRLILFCQLVNEKIDVATIFVNKGEKVLTKQRPISQIQLLSPYIKKLLPQRHFPILSRIYSFVTYLTRLSINQLTQRQMAG